MLGRIKSMGRRIKLIVQNPLDIKMIKFDRKCCKDGIVLVTHESNNLGASILLKHIASELVDQGYNVYIISRQFGVLNKEYSKIAPTQIVMTNKSFALTLSKLRKYGYSRLLFNTVVCGDLVKIAKDEGYKVVSLIHELAKVVKMLSCEKNTEEMIKYSDRTVFSTNVAKKEVLDLLGIHDNSSILIKPQGLYYKTPSEKIINGEIDRLKNKYPIDNYDGVVIGVGNTTERKGFDLFVETAAQLPDILFFWAGKKESYYDTVLKQNDNKLPDNFIFLGVLNSQELAGLYSVASVLLMSSRKDTLPSIIFESLLFTVPVIGSMDSGGIVDIINENNGILTDSATSKQFADAVRIVLKSETMIKLKSWIKNNQSKCVYSFSDYVSFIVSLYSQI